MAATSDEFLELIGQEIHVDIARLQRLAFYGIPRDVRKKVWKILIPEVCGVTYANAQSTSLSRDDPFGHNSVEDQLLDMKDVEVKTDPEILRMIRGELNRCHFVRNGVDYFKQTKVRETMEHILLRYFHRHWNEENAYINRSIVHLLCPFAYVFKKHSDAIVCFEYLARALQPDNVVANQRKMLAKFLMLFRSRLPELYTHFEDEDIEHTRWADSWLQWLLCRELPLDCCLRLWDSYFSNPANGFELHIYVCLAILENCQGDLLDLEYMEIMAFLRHIPSLDMDRIIHHAQCLELDFRQEI